MKLTLIAASAALLAFVTPAVSQQPFDTTTRQWRVEVGIRLTAQSGSNRPQTITAGTPALVAFPEQQVEQVGFETDHCRGRVREVGPTAAWLTISTTPLRGGEVAEARVIYRVRTQVVPVPAGLDPAALTAGGAGRDSKLRPYLQPSPGIESSAKEFRTLAESLAANAAHDWDALQAYFRFAHEQIQYRLGDYTSAQTALQTRVGDCEEKAAVFIALCRARGIPARTVWTQEHCWAEFHLVDAAGQGHWFPAHTSGPAWFGELGMAPVILGKGDSFEIPGSGLPTRRTLDSWSRGTGPAAKLEPILTIQPWRDGP